MGKGWGLLFMWQMYIWTWNLKENPQEKLDLNPALYQEKRKLTCVIIKKWLKKSKNSVLANPVDSFQYIRKGDRKENQKM